MGKVLSKKKKLTDMQIAFAHEYAVDRNASQAAIRAGFSEKTSKVKGYQLLQCPEIKALVQKLLLKKQAQTGYTAEKIIEMHREIYDQALEQGQLAPAVSALKAITDLLGIEPPKKMDVTSNGETMGNATLPAVLAAIEAKHKR